MSRANKQENTILVTGSGFIGGHIITYFIMHGMHIIALFNKQQTEAKRNKQKSELRARITAEQQNKLTECDGDITNYDDITQLFSEYKPDAMIHTAALLVAPVLREKYDSDTDEQYQIVKNQYEVEKNRFIEVNEAKVLADCIADYQKINAKFYVLFLSTMYAFDLTANPITEETARDRESKSLYAKTKISAENYLREKVINLAVAFLPQVIGPFQFTPAALAKAVEQLITNAWPKFVIKGEMNPIHVNNLVKQLYVLCLYAKTGLFCVNGDGVMALKDAARTLQQVATDFLKKQGKSVYPLIIEDSTAFNPAPKMRGSKLDDFFQAKCPDSDLHEVIPFEETAEKMVEAYWKHTQFF